MKYLRISGILLCMPVLHLQSQVVPVEPGHSLRQIVNSMAPTHPSQVLLETALPPGSIESIAVNPLSGDIYVQSQFPPGAFQSITTHIFRITASGAVSPVALNTGFGINERGTDMHWLVTRVLPPGTGTVARLLTQDQNQNRIVAVNPLNGAISSYAPFVFFGQGTLGMALSRGAGGSDVPAGQILFTSDVMVNGIFSTAEGGPVIPHALPPMPGDDLIVQPDGDWVHIGDSGGPVAAFRPFVPHPFFPSPTGLSALNMFLGAGRPFVYGTRATACPATGEAYVSYSGSLGGTSIFRVNEPLTVATRVIDINWPQGLQDLTAGPSSGLGMSVYFTVHDAATGGEQVWEVTTPECPGGRVRIDIKPGSDPNSINTNNNGRLPVAILGSPTLAVQAIAAASVRFGPASAAPVHFAVENVNGDGFPDLILQFEQRATGLSASDTEACLSGSLSGGGEIVGCDSVRIVR